MLFEIKPVALKAMVVTVVAGVALWSVHSVPADPSDMPLINDNDVTIGQVLNVGRVDGDICITTHETDRSQWCSRAISRCPAPLDSGFRRNDGGCANVPARCGKTEMEQRVACPAGTSGDACSTAKTTI